jgi:hypothetical protein
MTLMDLALDIKDFEWAKELGRPVEELPKDIVFIYTVLKATNYKRLTHTCNTILEAKAFILKYPPIVFTYDIYIHDGVTGQILGDVKETVFEKVI